MKDAPNLLNADRRELRKADRAAKRAKTATVLPLSCDGDQVNIDLESPREALCWLLLPCSPG